MEAYSGRAQPCSSTSVNTRATPEPRLVVLKEVAVLGIAPPRHPSVREKGGNGRSIDIR